MTNPEESPRILAMACDADAGVLRIELSDGTRLETAPGAPEVQDLATGAFVDATLRERLGAAAARKAVARHAMRLLSRRLYTRRRLSRLLSDAGHGAVAIDAVLERLVAEGLVDDAYFALAYARDHVRNKAVGRQWLQRKLRDLGVPETEARAAVDQVQPKETEGDAAERALLRRTADLRDERGRARAMRFLLSRGFSRGVASHAVLSAVAQQRETRMQGGADAEE